MLGEKNTHKGAVEQIQPDRHWNLQNRRPSFSEPNERTIKRYRQAEGDTQQLHSCGVMHFVE